MSRISRIDDCKSTGADDSSVLVTPIGRPSGDHSAHLADNLPRRGNWGDIAKNRCRRSATIRPLPLVGDQSRPFGLYPDRGELRSFRFRYPLLRPTSAVLRCSAVSRSVASIFAQLPGIPAVNFYDDFSARAPYWPQEEALPLCCVLFL